MAGLQLAFVNYTKGAYIVVEGHKTVADRFFIIRQGKVRISKEIEVVAEEGGNILGPGDFFAVVATMSSHTHIETAQALTDVTLISVMKEQYGQLIQNNAGVAMKIIVQFSMRMRYLDGALTRITLKSNAKEEPDHLFNIAEYYFKQKQYPQAYYAYHQYLKYCPNGETVDKARNIMEKIAGYAQSVRFDYPPDELVREYLKDTMIFSENEPGEELFIMQKGSVKITKIVDNNEVILGLLKQGDIFGEMALLESMPRSANAIAFENSLVMVVNRANFERMVTSQPQMIARLTTLLAERIWLVYKQLANAMIEDPLGRAYGALLMQLEKGRFDVNSAQSHTFEFGPKELAGMIGMSQADSEPVIRKILENPKFQLHRDRISVQNISEVVKQVGAFKRIQQRDKARREASSKIWS
jgi:CRP-like cAMP-binding protein